MKSINVMSALAAALTAACICVGVYAEEAITGAAAELYSEQAQSEYSKPVMSCTGLTAGSVTLKWDKVSGASAYRVYRYSSSKGKFMKYKELTACSLNVTDLKPEKEYRFYVAALGESGEVLARSENFTVKTPAEEIKLSAPTGLTASSKTYNSVTLKWDEVSGASGYRIYSYDFTAGKYVKYKNVTDTSCKVTGLNAGTEYRFRVASLSSKDGKLQEHGKSAALTVTTPEKEAEKLAAPTGLIDSASTQTSITLKWNKVSGACGYRVYKYDDDEMKFVKYKNVTGTSCKVTGLAADTGYTFKVASLVRKNGKLYEQKCTEEYEAFTAPVEETLPDNGMNVSPGSWKAPRLGSGMSTAINNCGIGEYVIKDDEELPNAKMAVGYTYFGGIKSGIGLYFNSKGELYSYTLMIPTTYSKYLDYLSYAKEAYSDNYQCSGDWYLFGPETFRLAMEYDYDTGCTVNFVSSSLYEY